MFSQLRTRITLLYAGLFGLVLCGIAASLYPVISARALSTAEGELRATAKSFERIEQLRLTQFRDSASIAARDFGFRSAAATRDPETVGSALRNLKQRIDSDFAYLVFPDGTALTEPDAKAPALPASLIASLENAGEVDGALVLNDIAFRAAATPVAAPDLIGWLLIGSLLDDEEMRSISSMSAIPLDAQLFVNNDGDWKRVARANAPRNVEGMAPLASLLEMARNDRPADRHIAGDALSVIAPLASIDSAEVRLLISYPIEAALAPFRSLLTLLFGLGLFGLAVLGVCSWFLARSITRPLAALEAAARRIEEEGDYTPVEVASKDEIGRLARSFNLMIAAIAERTRTITHLALHDRETDLPNRENFERELRLLIERGEPVYVGVIGIARFTQIRDAIGYRLAGALVAKLGQALGARDIAAPPARLSAELLAVAFTASDDGEAAVRLAQTLSALEQPVEIEGQRIDVAMTGGFARGSDQSTGPSAIERASIAFDQARRLGRKVAPFDAAAYGDPVANLSLMGELVRALGADQIYLVHQPKLNLRTGRIDSVESLIRWQHPERGAIRPDIFVPMAEETGHIRALTAWVLGQAVHEQRLLADAGLPLHVSVNISGRLVGDPAFTETALRATADARCDICFEITETAVMADSQRALEQLRAFSEQGIALSIDDYGSGLSSLAYLKLLPAQELKIDRMMLDGLSTNSREAFLIRSTVDLGHGLGMKVTAEGVEDPTTLALLVALGCDFAQGYAISRPLRLADLQLFLNQRRPDSPVPEERKAG